MITFSMKYQIKIKRIVIFPYEINMAKNDAAFVAKVIQPIILEILPLFFFFKILLSLEILIIAKRIGTVITPLIMAAYTRAFIGSILLKFIDNPIRVDIVITK